MFTLVKEILLWDGPEKQEDHRMVIIAGLGNPTAQYRGTRHNMGFMFADNFAIKHSADFKLEPRLRSEIASFFLNGDKIIIVKPQTYMNLSGEALSLVKNFYKIENENILIVYDDISLPLGKMRFRDKGSDGGHNGIKSIALHMGTTVFDRLKLGIGPQPEHMKSDVYVLQNFTAEQLNLITETMPKFIEAVEFYLQANDFFLVQSKYNG